MAAAGLSRSRGRVRALLARAGLALFGLLAAFACGEAAMRVYEQLNPPPQPPPPDPALAGLPELESFFELARPHQRGRAMNVLWRTNGVGMRGPELARRADELTFRIALLGDSVAAGVGVPEEEIYASRLASLLAQASAGRRFEVLNFAMPGLDASGVLARSRQLAPRFHPQLFVYGYTLNDVFEPGEEDVALEPFDFVSFQRLLERVHGLHSRLLPALITRGLAIRAVFRPGPYTRMLLASYADPAMRARLAGRFAELKAMADGFHACAHVFVHTDLAALRFGHPFTGIYAQVADGARAAGLGASISFPAFRGRDSSRLRLGAMDGHPNAEGHRILAEALYDALRALPPECGLPVLPARGGE